MKIYGTKTDKTARIDQSASRVIDFDTALSIMGRMGRQKVNKYTVNLNNISHPHLNICKKKKNPPSNSKIHIFKVHTENIPRNWILNNSDLDLIYEDVLRFAVKSLEHFFKNLIYKHWFCFAYCRNEVF